MSAALKQLRKPLDLHALPPAQARVEIAKDVLAAIRARKLNPYSGVYVDSHDLYAAPANKDMRTALSKPGLTCHVCALGGLFVAAVARVNGVSVGDGVANDRAFMHYKLRPFFMVEQLKLIEAAFEAAEDYAMFEPDALKAQDFGLKYHYDTDRMVAIMRNIIKNKGTFKP